MYDFILLQYKMKRINSAQVEQFAVQGWITNEEAEQIISSV